jgi:hypothetical protein
VRPVSKFSLNSSLDPNYATMNGTSRCCIVVCVMTFAVCSCDDRKVTLAKTEPTLPPPEELAREIEPLLEARTKEAGSNFSAHALAFPLCRIVDRQPTQWVSGDILFFADGRYVDSTYQSGRSNIVTGVLPTGVLHRLSNSVAWDARWRTARSNDVATIMYSGWSPNIILPGPMKEAFSFVLTNSLRQAPHN